MAVQAGESEWTARLPRAIQRRVDRLARALSYRVGQVVAADRGRQRGKPRICIWAAAFQADILALTHALADSGEVDLLVVTPRSEVFRRQPIQQVKPLPCRILDRHQWRSLFAARRFGADLVIIDDLFPDYPIAPRLMVLWHGLGMWKVKPRAEIATFAEQARPHAGDVTKPNPRFLAQCYGELTYKWWVREWGLAPECCEQLGMAYSDWILHPPYSREYARRSIGLPDQGGPTVLLSLSWHYGSRSGTWGHLTKIARLVSETVASYHGDVILCLHDRGFYEPTTREALDGLAGPHLYVRYRDQHPDNLADLLAADVMISNYSSFLGFFYVTGKPSIHLDPRNADGSMPKIASYASGNWALHSVGEEDVWLHSFDDHGGLAVRTPGELAAAIHKAISDSACCQDRCRRFLEEHVVGMDGQTSRRIVHTILDWISAK